MHTNQTFNYLTFDSYELLPLPSAVKDNPIDFDLSEVIWNTYGLPAFQATFTMTGNQLYFEKNAQGMVNLNKETFTGEVIITGILVPKSESDILFLTFGLVFCNGTLSSANLIEQRTQPRAEYKAGYDKFVADMDTAERITKSFWFKYLYTPYYHTLTWGAGVIIVVAKFLIGVFAFIVDKMLPYKL